MSQESLLELLEGHILGLFLLAQLSFFSLLLLDFVDNIESAAIIALKVGAAQLPNNAVLLNRLEEALANVADQVLLLHFLEIAVNRLLQSLAMLAVPEQLLNFGEVVLLAIFLMLLENLNACAAVSVPDVLDELGAVTNQLTLNRVHKGARPLVEAIRAAHLHQKRVSSWMLDPRHASYYGLAINELLLTESM